MDLAGFMLKEIGPYSMKTLDRVTILSRFLGGGVEIKKLSVAVNLVCAITKWLGDRQGKEWRGEGVKVGWQGDAKESS